MQENNLYKNMPKENSASMIFHLFNRHDKAAESYRQIAEDLDAREDLKTWFSNLADFRQQLAEEVRQMVKDNGEVPVKPSNEMKHYLHDRQEDIIRFINEENMVGLIELSLKAEKSVGDYYKSIEANKDIPLPIRERLEAQHNRLSEVIRKAERLRTVPESSKADLTINNKN